MHRKDNELAEKLAKVLLIINIVLFALAAFFLVLAIIAGSGGSSYLGYALASAAGFNALGGIRSLVREEFRGGLVRLVIGIILALIAVFIIIALS